jgi:hypothetical protein
VSEDGWARTTRLRSRSRCGEITIGPRECQASTEKKISTSSPRPLVVVDVVSVDVVSAAAHTRSPDRLTRVQRRPDHTRSPDVQATFKRRASEKKIRGGVDGSVQSSADRWSRWHTPTSAHACGRTSEHRHTRDSVSPACAAPVAPSVCRVSGGVSVGGAETPQRGDSAAASPFDTPLKYAISTFRPLKRPRNDPVPLPYREVPPSVGIAQRAGKRPSWTVSSSGSRIGAKETSRIRTPRVSR